MIILYEKNEQEFSSLGIGALLDTTSCTVTEELNGSFELEMEYPISGAHYNDIQLQRIILVKPNLYDDPQPFRIYSITKPIDGIVNIKARHISYDTTTIPVGIFSATSLADALQKIKDNSAITNPFVFYTDMESDETMSTTSPQTFRSLLGDEDGCLLDIYGGEYVFDKFQIKLLTRRGSDRGVYLRYGKNLTDLEHESTTTRMYTGVYPFYYNVETSSSTQVVKYYKEVYIRPDTIPFSDDWIADTNVDGAGAYIPTQLTAKPVGDKIATEGEYYGKIIAYDYIYDDKGNYTYQEGHEGESDYRIKGWKDVTDIASDDVYPPSLYKVDTVSTETTKMVELDEKIIYLDGQENADPQRILTLDLTSEFDSEPTQEALKTAAQTYIDTNKLGTVYSSLTVSFIKLSASQEYSKWKDLEVVKLGDTVHVEYYDLGVNEEMKITATEFDAISNKYTSVTLGDKSSTLSDNVLTTGDSVSSLSNDANYTDKNYVNSLIVDRLNATYAKIDELVASLLTAENATINKTLTAGDIKVVGCIEATSGIIGDCVIEQIFNEETGEYDTVLSVPAANITGVLTAEQIDATDLHVSSANIDGQLEANQIKTEDIVVTNSINIYATEKDSEGKDVITTKFIVDSEGNVTANSLELTGGSISLYKTEKNEAGENVIVSKFEVDSNGNMTAVSATIVGNITATSGTIGGCTIDEDGKLLISAANIDGQLEANQIKTEDIVVTNSINIYATEKDSEGKDVITTKFIVDSEGNVTANSLELTGGSISLYKTDDKGNIVTKFEVDEDGNVTTNSITITGGNISLSKTEKDESGEVYFVSKFEVDENGLLTVENAIINGEITATSGKIGDCVIGEDGSLQVSSTNIIDKIKASQIETEDIVVTNSINIYATEKDSEGKEVITTKFIVDSEGNVTANSLELTGGSISLYNTDGDGNVTTKFEVDENGNLYANSVEIEGKITATSGSIGDCEIVQVVHEDGTTEQVMTIMSDTLSVYGISTFDGDVTINSDLNVQFNIVGNSILADDEISAKSLIIRNSPGTNATLSFTGGEETTTNRKFIGAISTAYATYTNDKGQLTSIKYTYTLKINSYENTTKKYIPENTKITAVISYTDLIYGAQDYYQSKTIEVEATFKAGDLVSSTTFLTKTFTSLEQYNNFVNNVNMKLVSISPSSQDYTIINGSPKLTLDTSLFPEDDSTTLGDSSNGWNIYSNELYAHDVYINNDVLGMDPQPSAVLNYTSNTIYSYAFNLGTWNYNEKSKIWGDDYSTAGSKKMSFMTYQKKFTTTGSDLTTTITLPSNIKGIHFASASVATGATPRMSDATNFPSLALKYSASSNIITIYNDNTILSTDSFYVCLFMLVERTE